MKWYDKVKSDDFHIVRHGKWYVIAPAVIFLVGLILFFIPNIGFNLGLDFTGGSIIKVTPTGLNTETKDDFIKKIQEVMNEQGVKADIAMEKNTTGGNVLTVKFSETDTNMTDTIIKQLRTVPEFSAADVVGEPDTISASTSSEKIVSIMLAVLAALCGIMIYMVFRFKLTSGISAIIALFHDVLIMASLVIIFRVQINASFIAALITIVGYSINNTLVLFDRIRSYEKTNTNGYALEQIIDKSIKDTMGRTMVTTLTTLVPIVTLAVCSIFMRLSSLWEFSIPIVFGLIAGTYSSIFLTTAMYLRFEGARLINKKRKLNTNANRNKNKNTNKQSI
jgi:preprotein translocase subunit SecF